MAVDDVGLARHEGWAGGDGLRRLPDRVNSLFGGQIVGSFEQPAAERAQRRLPPRAAAHRLDQLLFKKLHPAVEEVFLGREIVEDCYLRDIAPPRDLAHVTPITAPLP